MLEVLRNLHEEPHGHVRRSCGWPRGVNGVKMSDSRECREQFESRRGDALQAADRSCCCYALLTAVQATAELSRKQTVYCYQNKPAQQQTTNTATTPAQSTSQPQVATTITSTTTRTTTITITMTTTITTISQAQPQVHPQWQPTPHEHTGTHFFSPPGRLPHWPTGPRAHPLLKSLAALFA